VSLFRASQAPTEASGEPKKNAAGNWVHAAWPGSETNCSGVFAAPPFQAAYGTGCKGRASTDVSAVSTNFAIRELQGWTTAGGTSLAAPVIASLAARMGIRGLRPATLYTAPGLSDVTTGNNYSCDPQGHCVPEATKAGIVTLPATYTCQQGPTQFCLARKGWDGPTGLGTPLHGKFMAR
jgi:hypothetical protein